MNFAYVPAVVWIVLLTFVLTRHIKVYRLYDSQLKVVRKIEQAGGIEDGSTLVATNQRVRYIVRIFLAAFGIVLGGAGVYAIYDPGFARSLLFAVAVIGYFYLSEVATGYLTIRDERVIGRILDIDRNTRAGDLKANTEAVDRNTEAVQQSNRQDDARVIADDARVIADHLNTEATEVNTEALTKNTEARDGHT